MTLRLPFRRPFHWDGMLAFLALRAVPGVEEVVDGAYRRVVALGTGAAVLQVRRSPKQDALLAELEPRAGRARPLVVKRLRGLFDLDADSARIDRALARERRLAPRVQRAPGTRVPGSWDRFELGVRAILGQQVTVRAATTVAGRIAARFGRPLRATVPAGSSLAVRFPEPDDLVEADLATAGMPGARAAAIRGFARAAADGELAKLDDVDALRERLCRLPGIGPWTAGYVALRSLGDRDVFLEGDLGVRHALARGGVLPTPRRVLEIAEAWRPWRSYAVIHLWSQPGPPGRRVTAADRRPSPGSGP